MPETNNIEKNLIEGGDVQTAEQDDSLATEEYEKLLDQYNANVSEGEVVKGHILHISSSEVIVDVGYKSEGIIALEEFHDESGKPTIKVGDEVEVLLEKVENKEGYLILSREKAEKMKVWDQIESAYQTKEVVTGRVIERIKGGLAVDIGVRAFLPGSQVDVRPVRNLDSLRGQELRMRVIKVNKKRGNIVLSRKVVLEEELTDLKDKTLGALEEGRVFRGVVKNLTDYGAFIDLGGIDGLTAYHGYVVWTYQPSVGAVQRRRPSRSRGPEVRSRERARIVGLQAAGARSMGVGVRAFPSTARVSRARSSLLPTTALSSSSSPASRVSSTCRRCLGASGSNIPPRFCTVGDMAEAMVLQVDPSERRISFGLKQVEPNPWELLAEKYEPGSRIEGRVRNLTDFGAFVEVEEGIDGLIHISDLTWNKRVKHPSEVIKKGDTVEAVVLNIDADNQRLSLGLKQLATDIWEEFFNRHKVR